MEVRMAREISTSTEIEVSPGAIWEVLTDFSRYSEWNSFLPKVWGRANVGERIRFIFELPRGFRMKARATILKVDPLRELRWAGSLPIPGLIRAEHYFILKPLCDTRTRFDHGELFTGLLIPFLWPVLRGKGRQVYLDMNEALKERVESRTDNSGGET